MTPTIEEVKKVADTLLSTCGSCGVDYVCTIKELQAFAQNWIKVGRKEQREKDALLVSHELGIFKETEAAHYRMSPQPFKAEHFGFDMMHLNKLATLAKAIRNNTGE